MTAQRADELSNFSDTTTQPLSPILSQMNSSAENAGKPSIYVRTDRLNYVNDQKVIIFGKVTDQQGRPVNSSISISVAGINPREEAAYNVSVFASNGKVMDTGFNPEAGRFRITVTSLINGEEAQAFTEVEIQDLFTTLPFRFLLLAIGFFTGLAILISKGTRSEERSEIIRFICISGIVFSVISGFIFTNLQVGNWSPIGLVLTSHFTEEGINGGAWIINIGGSVVDDYATGVQIPVYVIIFGIAGGYLRYLYKTAKLRTGNKTLEETYIFSWENIPGKDSLNLKDFLRRTFEIDWLGNQDFVKENVNTIRLSNLGHFMIIVLNGKRAKLAIDNDKTLYEFIVRKEDGIGIYQAKSPNMWLFNQSLEDLALLFLAPLLAIAVWFILTQAGTTATHTIAVTSFAVGLVTDDIVRRLTKFARTTLGGDETIESENEGKKVVSKNSLPGNKKNSIQGSDTSNGNNTPEKIS